MSKWIYNQDVHDITIIVPLSQKDTTHSNNKFLTTDLSANFIIFVHTNKVREDDQSRENENTTNTTREKDKEKRTIK